MEDSSDGWSDTDESESSSDDDATAEIDTHYDMVLSRQRKDSGVCDEYISIDVEPTGDDVDKDMHQIEKAFGGIDCCLDSGSFDNHDQDPSATDNKVDRDIEHVLVGKRRDLRRQRSIDGSSDVLNSIVAEGEVKLRNMSTSRSSRSSLGSLKRKSSSVSSSGSFTEPWLKTSSFSSQTSQGESSFDNDIIEYDEDELRARDCDQKRQSWANTGKQESITSELSKLQVLDDGMLIGSVFICHL